MTILGKCVISDQGCSLKKHELSPEEIKTLESYKKIAQARGKTHSDPEFWRSEFQKFRKLLPEGRVIDIACGSGRDTVLFVETGYEYVGIDLCDEMLAGARELVPGADFRKMDMYSLEFPPRSFDGFWATAALLHIPKQNVDIILQEIQKVMKPGGIGFFAMKEGQDEKMVCGSREGDERFFAFYQENEFLKILQDSGFEVLQHSRDMREYHPPSCTTVWLLYLVKTASN